MLQRYLIKFDYEDGLIRTEPFTMLIKENSTTAQMVYDKMINHIYLYARTSPTIKKSEINIINVIKL